MTKQDFLDKLRLALSGRIDPYAVAENISYYEDYINMEIRKGKSEEEVLAALGDPRLIAKTIAETNGTQDAGKHVDEEKGYSEYGQKDRAFKFSIPGWLWVILVIAVAVILVSAVFSLLSVVMPVLIPILAVVFLVKLFRDWVN